MLSRFTLLALFAGLSLGQGTAKKEITLDPQTLTRYTGTYQMSAGVTILITLEKNQLFSKLGNQPPIAIFPESKTMFFPKIVNAELEFAKDDAEGRPTEVILRQNGRDLPGKRLDDAQAKQIADAAIALTKRLKDQTADTRSESALRSMVVGLQQGKPNYDQMSAGLAAAVRQQLLQTQPIFDKLGPLRALIFKAVGPAGPDIYSVRFENGALEYRIWLSPDVKIDSSNFRPEDVETPVANLRTKLPEMDSLIAADMAQVKVGSVTAGVVSGKELIWSKSYGDADGEKKIVADTDTVYRIGSITKMFTALMLEQLVEAGKVHLSDPVEKYFPEVKLVQGRFPDAPPITLIQLATHTHRDWAVNRITRTPMCKARSRNGKKSSSRRFLTRITYWSRAAVFPTQT